MIGNKQEILSRQGWEPRPEWRDEAAEIRAAEQVLIDAENAVNNETPRKHQEALNNLIASGKLTAQEIEKALADRISIDEHKEINRQQRRAVQAARLVLYIHKIAPLALTVLADARKPIAEFAEDRLMREQEFALVVGVPFAPSDSLLACQRLVAHTDNLIAQFKQPGKAVSPPYARSVFEGLGI